MRRYILIITVDTVNKLKIMIAPLRSIVPHRQCGEKKRRRRKREMAELFFVFLLVLVRSFQLWAMAYARATRGRAQESPERGIYN